MTIQVIATTDRACAIDYLELRPGHRAWSRQRPARCGLTRLVRLALGNPGDSKPIGAGVAELRIDVGPGYRAYYMRAGESVHLVLGAGDKSSQAKDIARAIQMANELKSAARAKKARRSK